MDALSVESRGKPRPAVLRWLGHFLIFALLTALTQLGGLAWLGAVALGPAGLGRRLISFPVIYALLWGIVYLTAPMFGREALPCFGGPLRAQSPVYCVLMRNYVTPDMASVARAAAEDVAQAYPGTVTLALDGGFPSLDGFALLPHLSHDDGEKLDFAFYYTGPEGYVPGRTRSPLGYFAFETLGSPTCPPDLLTLRWDMRWLQGLWPTWPVDVGRTTTLVSALLADARVGKVFIEPPLAARWGLADAKLRFQGCRAARHDDHVHVQL